MRRRTTIHWRTGGTSRRIPTLLAAALVLGGCSATHVGDAWQCPVAQGAACASVAEADPAVTTVGKARGPGSPEPAGQREGAGAGGSGAACAGNCDPLAWLAERLSILEGPHGGAAPVEPVSISPDEELRDVSGGGLRTKERIARIWIAPFVDAKGIYREGHWVRAVLEPARWRLR